MVILMTKEQLIAQGLTEAQADAVLKLHKEAIDGNYVPKATFEAERQKLKDANAQIEERDKQIKELGKFKGTAEELQAKVAELEEANKTSTQEYQKKLEELEKDYAIRAEIIDSVIDPEDVIPKLDKTLLVFKDGKIVSGLKEQLDALKQSKPHYFKQEQKSNEWNKFSGFNFFGKTPPESKAPDSQTSDSLSREAEFGKLLAQTRMHGMQSVLENGQKAYFN